MAIHTYKPTTPSRRHMTVSAFEGIDKKAKPERSLTEIVKKNSGRNSYGRITVRHRGGGNKRKYRIIDFKRQKDGVAEVLRLEYDPNRSANIALLQYEDGSKALYPGSCRPEGRRQGGVLHHRRHQARQLPASRPTSPWVPSSAASSCIPARAASWSAPLASRLS